jgi:hypothetical protein
MRNIERFRKVRHYTPEINPTTAPTLMLSSTTIGNVSGQILGANFEVTIWASSAPIYLGFTSGLTTTNGFELDDAEYIEMMVENQIWSEITTAASGKFKAIVWD